MAGWVAVPDDVYADPRLAAVGPRAAWLWLCGRAYAGQRATDGAVPRLVLRLAGATTTDAARLVEAGLWTTTTTTEGWYDAGFLALNASAAEREASRAFERERKARRRAIPRTSDDCPTGTTSGTTTGTPAVLPVGIRHTQVQVQEQVHGENPPSPLVSGPATTTKRARKSADEHPLPSGWEPTDAHRTFASEHGLRLDLEVAGFKGHAEAVGRRCRSWNGAFATWLARTAARRSTTTRPIQLDSTATPGMGFKSWGT